MELTMLGTGNALVTECYNTCFVLQEEKQYFLVDGGGGNEILHRLKIADINWKEIRTIFVTHKHVDHLLGILWMIRMICQKMNRGEYEGDATIYAHEEVADLLKDMAEKLYVEKETKFIGKRLHILTVGDGDEKEILGRKVTFFDIGSTKAKQFGFSMDLGEGKKLTCCGDEPYRNLEEKYAKDSTWLLHEAFCLESEADIFHPYEKHHSTVKDACELAEKLNVKNLLLYHTEDKNIKNRKKLYEEEGKKYFHGNLYVPDDLEKIKI
ncbi:MAG: MBL fold metallo-hydrolase [Eubacterium sp.]|nr:MBL fold metallo-hydrolase [Eubacterium sp.]MDD7209218.1 MBL fold metallo-hydrolase [Lachnospiraceae bacterium]MDY5497956.1 MBL fold metallo-hydrolase [Anaerobutyricum sp.]